MSKTTTLILGGGFGGIAAANTLRQLLPAEHEIIIVDKKSTFNLGATKTWVMLGECAPEQVMRNLNVLSNRGIDFVQAEVQKIDPLKREVVTSNKTLRGDFLVLALGADLNVSKVPGLESAAETFYTLAGALRLRQALPKFASGNLVILIPATPFKCPPGPYEAAMLLHEYFLNRGRRDKIKLSIYTLEAAPMATAGPQMGQFIREELQKRDIHLATEKRCKSVDGVKGLIDFEDGSTAPFDLLIAIPPHEAPQAVRDAGLTDASGWIPVDPQSLKTNVEHVYAIGDLCKVPLPGRFKPEVPLVLPKAGVFAEAHGRVVAHQIAAKVLGKEATETFNGLGYCYIETGNQQAVRGDGEFFALPHPQMKARPADLAQKQAWAEEWVKRYL
ncbi:MAG: NAD(P)/FAD-dependent oxidoreductase [candidate division KSB1 bacterium]|nr:NAD(P)/FAD-dependent oxidoreductase [candidate division KSB1 bacterium]MDZ7365502.1 NAD(P)/FAD-dependent oxidoreductase [candidate division KSB1 bacterium]MDZ7403605.1 NAD(P)/FAD-dependent oxidoreductase [candidate division KSB1 bacterium]